MIAEVDTIDSRARLFALSEKCMLLIRDVAAMPQYDEHGRLNKRRQVKLDELRDLRTNIGIKISHTIDPYDGVVSLADRIRRR